MGREYKIIDRLKQRNERPVVFIDEEHKYPINTSKTNVLLLMATIKKAEKKEKTLQSDPAADIRMIDELIVIALGKDALTYINSQNMTMAATNDIVTVIMAAIADKKEKFDDDEDIEKK